MKADNNRLLSLDVFRGMTIAGMILVNSPGNETAYAPLDHAEWNGLTPTDLVFPFFVFIVGVSLVFSLSKRLERGESRGAILWQVFKRASIIFGLGLLLNGFPYYHLASIRIPGVLQRIALCYFFGAVFYLYTTIAVQIGTAIAILLGYWWAMTHIPVPGFGAGILTKEGSLASYIDRMILGGHMYRPVYDPEGILSTLPAIASVILGNLTGIWLRWGENHVRKVTGMLQAGFVLVLLGWKWNAWFPINKALWTSSYVLITTGLALILFSLCYWLIDDRGWKRWSKPFEVFGVNALAAYFLHVFFLKVQNLWKMPQMNGEPGNIRFYLSEHLFGTWMSRPNASLAYARSYTLFWLIVFSILYRRRIFIKV
jgi:predicted acyltransferase